MPVLEMSLQVNLLSESHRADGTEEIADIPVDGNVTFQVAACSSFV